VVIGVWRYSPAKRYLYGGAPSHLPYHGQKRWHLVLGLVFGIATATYAFSGMLSMDPFPSLANRPAGFRRGGEASISSALRGTVSVNAYDAKPPRQALAQLGTLPVKQLELTSIAGEPAYLARLADDDTRVVPVDGEPALGFDRERIIRLVAIATNGRVSTSVLSQYDRYYLDRDRALPLPVVLAQLTTGERTRYYIDPRTARIVRTYSSRNWVNRWLYSGLHSLNFPWLYNYRPLWDIVVITLMLGGTALGGTSLVLAWRVLGRRLAGKMSLRGAPDEPDLSNDVA